MRKDLLREGEIYHIFNKSIAGYTIFNDDSDYFRMINAIHFYQRQKHNVSFSFLIKLAKSNKGHSYKRLIPLSLYDDKENLLEIIAYCFMPTHFHFILKQIKEDGISIFMSNIQNSYTRFFNLKHNRKGPLWEGRFKNVLVKTDEQLFHLTRYIHLNPVTASLVDKPQKWLASSYQEYISEIDNNDKICKLDRILDIEPLSYKEFVEDRISYQKELAKLKELIFE